MLESFLSNEDMRTAWRRACIEADKENMRIDNDELPELRTGRCPLSPHEEGRHVCQGCLQDNQCQDFALVAEVGCMLCPSCQVTKPSVLDRNISYHAGEHSRLRTRLDVAIKQDDLAVPYKSSPKERAQRVGAILNQICEKQAVLDVTEEGHKYRDAYVDQIVPEHGKSSHHISKPRAAKLGLRLEIYEHRWR